MSCRQWRCGKQSTARKQLWQRRIEALINLDAIVGTVVTDGNSEYANQVRPPARPHHARTLTPSRLIVGRARCGRA